MALNSSGPISLAGSTTGQSIAVELGVSATAQISLNCTNVRTLAGVASGAITMPTNFYGKSNTVVGSASYTTAGSYTWVAPTGVTSVSVVTVGVGGNRSCNFVKAFGVFYRGGGGGSLSYKNSITVTPGTGYTVNVGAASDATTPTSYFVNTSTVNANGGVKCSAGSRGAGDGGGNGGTGGVANTGVFGGAGGAGGYSGAGGNGGICTCTSIGDCIITYTANPTAGSGGGGGGAQVSGCYTGGGGVGLFGQGANGAAGGYTSSAGGGSGGGSPSGYASNGGLYGGGAGWNCGTPGSGAVRIVYPGTTRKFPSTCVGSP